ncbi:coenzyme F420-0:L-glutamate ligase [Bittarella massiliensis]|uniref:coenzyme F420-0:L-glutamate ligase n=1 Tax=Bittarella massiliensis (ex Durand et al. 2017) TaxID=1720313 RepID=UPI00163BACB4|nr:coenzyme F420-0:L-glutamate ligase [Bittarella massiliensis (ex Durand et al. 2017)]MBC2872060.1 coenzyme F420-0:L-glutamate ligase [Bittarella massiliensis (ex Durand et al. 2017)]
MNEREKEQSRDGEKGVQRPASVAGTVINPDKEEEITWQGMRYRRLCIRTPVITAGDDIVQVASRYAGPLLEKGDILFVTEKAVACTQRRAIPLEEIHPRPLARFLSRFVRRTPYGIGLAMPETMECALRECGTLRILLAAAVSAVGKLLGERGWFYRVAGYRAASIDGPCPNTLPPYNRYVVLGPLRPDGVAEELAQALGCAVAVVDLNDLGGEILGVSDRRMDRAHLCNLLRDNPLGQCSEQTPMGILRRG